MTSLQSPTSSVPAQALPRQPSALIHRSSERWNDPQTALIAEAKEPTQPDSAKGPPVLGRFSLPATFCSAPARKRVFDSDPFLFSKDFFYQVDPSNGKRNPSHLTCIQSLYNRVASTPTKQSRRSFVEGIIETVPSAARTSSIHPLFPAHLCIPPAMAAPAPENSGQLQAKETQLAHKSSHESLSPQPFPAFDEKNALCTVSTPATTRASPFDADLEAGAAVLPVYSQGSSSSLTANRKSAECTKGGSDCQVWPGQDHWRRKAKDARKNRHSCRCLAGMSKRNRIMIRIAIIVFIVGIAVAVGFGISKPLGAPIWGDETKGAR
ncbi:hypothetical protein VTJ83DRAFT_3839 [Remersonia thermophila]|uniref:Transmembrane protein n=1 Tax=Remersonia thermophila TaxID=72144 RepID=A0ABR4DF43_9PEZI